MNRLGAERRPFLFVIDYKQEQVIVEEPDQIDSEALLYNLDGVTNVATASRMNDRENRTSAIRWETFPITQSVHTADGLYAVIESHIRKRSVKPPKASIRRSRKKGQQRRTFSLRVLSISTIRISSSLLESSAKSSPCGPATKLFPQN